MELTQSTLQELEPRLKKMAVVLFVVLGLIGARLYYLQVIKGKFYHLFSEENSIREIPVPALRGILWDRNGIPLVENRAAFDLVLTPQFVVDPKQVFGTLEKNLQIPAEKLEAKWKEKYRWPAYQPIVVLQDVSLDMVSWVRAHKSPWGALSSEIDLRGVDIRERFEREYPDGDIASHVLGYVREIDAERLRNLQKKWSGRYRLGDQVGIRGLEEVWDRQIRGEDGFLQKVVNAVGREIYYPGIEEELQDKQAVNGLHLKLTLDTRLQKIARDYFKGKTGAAVALDPNDGAVLLLYSAPSFDLNRLGGERGSQYWQEMAADPAGYFINRPLQGAYPPGSTYKIVTGTGALSEGVVKTDEKVHCGGSLFFGNRAFHCWRSGGHGMVEFHRGLVASCDVFFYTMGLRLGVDRLSKYAHAFGLGEQSGIGLPDERSGFIPTSAWKLKARKEPWQEGETLSIAIGQGYDLVTPLQSAVMISMVANGGKKIRPYLVEEEMDPVSGSTKKIDPEPVVEKGEHVTLSPEVIEEVKKGLVGVVAEPEGTAHRLSALKIPMGGKTGTAQVVSLGKSCRGNACLDHAWFVAFAPVENPKIAVAVLVEHGGHGGATAAPLAAELIKAYLNE
ncbi:MAG: penicillin-binding protein 2 [Deltaproteobacteria bacterium]|nr:penicillin-binding protein 2 [Deltaproteobacteria bacterium]